MAWEEIREGVKGKRVKENVNEVGVLKHREEKQRRVYRLWRVRAKQVTQNDERGNGLMKI